MKVKKSAHSWKDNNVFSKINCWTNWKVQNDKNIIKLWFILKDKIMNKYIEKENEWKY